MLGYALVLGLLSAATLSVLPQIGDSVSSLLQTTATALDSGAQAQAPQPAPCTGSGQVGCVTTDQFPSGATPGALVLDLEAADGGFTPGSYDQVSFTNVPAASEISEQVTLLGARGALTTATGRGCGTQAQLSTASQVEFETCDPGSAGVAEAFSCRVLVYGREGDDTLAICHDPRIRATNQTGQTQLRLVNGNSLTIGICAAILGTSADRPVSLVTVVQDPFSSPGTWLSFFTGSWSFRNDSATKLVHMVSCRRPD